MVSWSTKKQVTVALSSCEAEYAAATQATKELLFLQRLTSELGVQRTKPTILHCDNEGAIKLAYNPEFHARTKHIDIQGHFVREVVSSKVMDIEWLASKDMPADGLTKPLAKPAFERFRDLIGM